MKFSMKLWSNFYDDLESYFSKILNAYAAILTIHHHWLNDNESPKFSPFHVRQTYCVDVPMRTFRKASLYLSGAVFTSFNVLLCCLIQACLTSVVIIRKIISHLNLRKSEHRLESTF